MRKQVILAGLTTIVLGIGVAHASPCNTGGKDAGSGPTPGAAGQTVGTAAPAEDKSHPPTAAMNSVAGDRATSSQDTQRQQQGQPTAAQQAQGAKSTQTADQGC